MPSRSTLTQPSETTERRMLAISLSRRLMSSTYKTPRCARARSPGSKMVLPCLTDSSTSTEPSKRSSNTLSGTVTNGHSITSVSISLSGVLLAIMVCFVKSSISSSVSGSMLNLESLMTSMGGSNLCMARAITDLPVPRPPAITTPPSLGFTAASRRAVLIGPCPTIKESGKLSSLAEYFDPMPSLASAFSSCMAIFARSSASVASVATILKALRAGLTAHTAD
mmetsp:Transcript_69814/g.102308  ORF Transcript_69814/g.102308 Transcript_69814/m.102308 type:complete len:224 (-) Transcript_69814:161-832(-)